MINSHDYYFIDIKNLQEFKKNITFINKLISKFQIKDAERQKLLP
jgi:hypothetical protein